MTPPDGTSLDAVIAIAREAGALALSMRGCGQERKDDGSIVTEADHAAEALIEARLAEAFGPIPVLGEEAVAGGATPALGADFFCVDPIDGTNQFAQGQDAWAVCIGRVIEGRPVQGVIFAPAMDRLFAGDTRLGGFEEMVGGARTPFPTAPPAREETVLAFGSHDGEAAVRSLARQFGWIAPRLLKVGSALKFGLVACGEADAFIRAGEVWDWDIAAGHALLRACGGDVTTLDGAPLRYGNPARGYRHPQFIARRAAAA